MEKFRRQIEELNIPYPQKHDLLQEIEADLQENDLGDTESFTAEDLARLSDIHRTRAYKLYSGQNSIVRKGLDIAFVYSPLFLMFLGLGWSVLGIYVTADSVVKASLSNQILLEGFKESFTPFLLSIFLSTLILLTHYGSRRLSVLWRIPSAT